MKNAMCIHSMYLCSSVLLNNLPNRPRSIPNNIYLLTCCQRQLQQSRQLLHLNHRCTRVHKPSSIRQNAVTSNQFIPCDRYSVGFDLQYVLNYLFGLFIQLRMNQSKFSPSHTVRICSTRASNSSLSKISSQSLKYLSRKKASKTKRKTRMHRKLRVKVLCCTTRIRRNFPYKIL